MAHKRLSLDDYDSDQWPFNLMAKENQGCRLCGRVMQAGLTEHHLIPRTLHSNKWFKSRFTRYEMNQTVSVCRDCHNAIHRFIPREKELGREYYTLELLANHPEIANFVQWVRKQR